MFFVVCQFTITRLRIPKIATHDALINFHDESKFQLSRFYRLQIMSKSILFCQNLRTETKVIYALTRSPNNAKTDILSEKARKALSD